MEQTVITVDNLWKQYKLGDINASSLKEEVHHWWTRYVLRKTNGEWPFEETGNDLAETNGSKAFWALQDINFEIRKGEALGVIGKNGAGKSTLLKILSRVTRPTKGSVKGCGRIASMLEVGTGFHDELTGRENIFLNGNILGMSNHEIKQKFDAIVDFSGIAKFIDTPVKRYSSGMYVRLAFSVAAHLDPDILILDEVLAVGDTEFQEKCLEKMKQIIADKGCTILLVSHNIKSVLELCNRVILLKQGRIVEGGNPKQVVNAYYELMGKRRYFQSWEKPIEAPGNELIRVTQVSLTPELNNQEGGPDIRSPLHIKLRFINLSPGIALSIGIHLFSSSGECIFDVSSESYVVKGGEFECSCTIPGNFLNDGEYYISAIFVQDTEKPVFYLEKCLTFELADYRENIKWQGKWMGAVRPKLHVQINETGAKMKS